MTATAAPARTPTRPRPALPRSGERPTSLELPIHPSRSHTPSHAAVSSPVMYFGAPLVQRVCGAQGPRPAHIPHQQLLLSISCASVAPSTGRTKRRRRPRPRRPSPRSRTPSIRT